MNAWDFIETHIYNNGNNGKYHRTQSNSGMHWLDGDRMKHGWKTGKDRRIHCVSNHHIEGSSSLQNMKAQHVQRRHLAPWETRQERDALSGAERG